MPTTSAAIPLRQLSATLRPDTTMAVPTTRNWITRAPSTVAPAGDNAASIALPSMRRSPSPARGTHLPAV